MLQEFHTDVVKVDRDDAFVAMVLHVCCKRVYLDVAYVSHICCKRFIGMLRMVYNGFSSVFYMFLQVFWMHVSNVSVFGHISQVLHLDVSFFSRIRIRFAYHCI
jgi:hypothetical protein